MKKKSVKIIFIIIIIIGFLIIGLFCYIKTLIANPQRPIIWGVTFSSQFSRQLNHDWQKTLKAILDELRPPKIRIIAYWEDMEKTKGEINFSDLDWQMNEAQKRNIKVILVAGMKVPRWAECHIPDWAKELSAEKREAALNIYLGKIVERFRGMPNLYAWQVENEPFLWFGQCPERGKNFLSNEISSVKSIDPNRPIIITDSGEFGLWYKAVQFGDIFGTTMYRRVHNKIFGYIDYHLPPGFFILKEKIIRFLINNYQKRFIVVELAAEPWMERQLYETAIEEQLKLFDLEFFKNTIDYAKATNFNEYYFWGAEWWYFLKQNNHPEIWDEAKKLWQ